MFSVVRMITDVCLYNVLNILDIYYNIDVLTVLIAILVVVVEVVVVAVYSTEVIVRVNVLDIGIPN